MTKSNLNFSAFYSSNVKFTKVVTLTCVSCIAIILGACGSPQAVEETPEPTQVESTAPQEEPTTEVAIAEIENPEDVTFVSEDETAVTGSFDGINGNNALTQTISKGTPIAVGGWAAMADNSKPAEQVIITAGDNNSIIAVLPVNVERTDVAESLKNQDYLKSGWVGKIEPSQLSEDTTTLRAWAYNPSTKEAFILPNVYEVNFN